MREAGVGHLPALARPLGREGEDEFGAFGGRVMIRRRDRSVGVSVLTGGRGARSVGAMRPHRVAVALSTLLTTAALAVAASPAQAGLSKWTQLQGLAAVSSPGPQHRPRVGHGVRHRHAPDDGLRGHRRRRRVAQPQRRPHLVAVLRRSQLRRRQRQLVLGLCAAAPQRQRPRLDLGRPVLGAGLAGGQLVSPLAQGPETDPQNPTKLNDAVETVASVSGRLLAGAYSEGVYTSTDDGQTWKPPLADNGMPAGTTVWNFASIGPVVWAASTNGIFRSTDGGSSWTLADDGIPVTATTFNVVEDSGNPLHRLRTDHDQRYLPLVRWRHELAVDQRRSQRRAARQHPGPGAPGVLRVGFDAAVLRHL